MAKSSVARHIGPLETIVNVGWAGGIFVIVNATAFYSNPSAVNRAATLTLTNAGKALGGKIIQQRVFHEPELLEPDEGSLPPGQVAHPKTSVFRWALRFSRMPKGTAVEDAFIVTLSGAASVLDLTTPPPLMDYFCGTSTATLTFVVGSREFQGQTLLTGTTTWSFSSPAGGGTISFTEDLGGGGTVDDIGNTVTNSNSTDSVWYQDAFGNFIDLHLPCSEIPSLPPLTASARVEGFNKIECHVLPTRGYEVRPATLWKWNEDVFAPRPGADTTVFGGPQYICRIPQVIAGLNSDFLPIFDDLADGPYKFKLATLLFSGLPLVKGKTFNVKGLYPTGPTFAKYLIEVATANPYLLHRTLPDSLAGVDFEFHGRLINVGFMPPKSITFD